MSYESYYWRKIIKRDIRYLENKLKLKHKDIEDNLEEHSSNVEIKFMTLSYVARKLADSHKLPDKTLEKKIKTVVYSRSKKARRVFGSIDKEYDFETFSVGEIKMRDLCNQVIHSYVLESSGTTRRAFRYLLFVSDRAKDNGLNQVDMKDFIKVMKQVAESYVTSFNSEYDSGKEEWTYEKF